MNLKVGDKVKIREDLKVGIYENHVSVQEEMLKYAGNIATLTKEPCPGVFKIDSDGEMWPWYPFMFEGIIANKFPKLEAGMAVHCDTVDKAKVFLQECKKQGVIRLDGVSGLLIPDAWKKYKGKIVFAINNIAIGGALYVGYCTKDYLEGDSRYNLYEFDELFKESLANKMTDATETFIKTFAENATKLNAIVSVNIRNLKSQGIVLPQDLVLTKGKMGNHVFLLNKYKVLYEKQYYKGEKDVKKVIMNGKCIIVILENGAKGIAKCSPEDTFDKDIGFKIALKRARNCCNNRGARPF